MNGPDVQRALAAVAEPTRFRIVELLASRACTVGEVAEAIGALQPQTTKHLQALEAAGVIRVHRLGRRRVARLDREAFGALSAYFGDLARPGADDAVLEDYERAILAEEAGAGGADRVLRFTRTLAADPAAVWVAWTDPARAARWWAPPHFTVERLELSPEPGATIHLVLAEGDGVRYASEGRVEAADPSRRLVFSLAPLGPDGAPLFAARHTLSIAGAAAGETELELTIDVSAVRSGAAPAVAGLESGWNQLLDALAASLGGGGGDSH
ncbi:MAG: metalloregulator ArsR/SmtB family transcription factor [Leifsonia sp.]|uniref:metalloregulator ArsR/SmtB family transcription factor n=1 Tax=Leifsonia sp. TaxID=1870902 RepID=UPI003F80792F